MEKVQKINDYIKEQKQLALLRAEIREELTNELIPILTKDLSIEIEKRIRHELESKYYLSLKHTTEINVDSFIELVILEVSKAYFLTPSDVKGKSREHPRSEARHIICYICRQMRNIPLGYIGKVLGGRDHATILWSKNQCKNYMATDKSFNALVENTIKIINDKLEPVNN